MKFRQHQHKVINSQPACFNQSHQQFTQATNLTTQHPIRIMKKIPVVRLVHIKSHIQIPALTDHHFIEVFLQFCCQCLHFYITLFLLVCLHIQYISTAYIHPGLALSLLLYTQCCCTQSAGGYSISATQRVSGTVFVSTHTIHSHSRLGTIKILHLTFMYVLEETRIWFQAHRKDCVLFLVTSTLCAPLPYVSLVYFPPTVYNQPLLGYILQVLSFIVSLSGHLFVKPLNPFICPIKVHLQYGFPHC